MVEPPGGGISSSVEDSRTSGRPDRDGPAPGLSRVESGRGFISIGASSDRPPVPVSRSGFGSSKGTGGLAVGLGRPGIASTARPTDGPGAGNGAVEGLETIGMPFGGVSSGWSPSPAELEETRQVIRIRLVTGRRSFANPSTLRSMDLSSIGPLRDDVRQS